MRLPSERVFGEQGPEDKQKRCAQGLQRAMDERHGFVFGVTYGSLELLSELTRTIMVKFAPSEYFMRPANATQPIMLHA